jgi:hypothetical protein
MGGAYPYKMKKSDMRYRDHLGRAPEATNLSGGEVYRQLDKLKKIYNLVWAKEKHIVGMTYPVDYENISGKIQNHINNKIKIDSDGNLYINTFDKLKFKPSEDKGDTYREWTTDKLKFLELREFIREEIWAVAKGEWVEFAKTYLLDDIGSTSEITSPEEKNEIKKEKIKGTDIVITRQIGLTLLNQYVKLKDLVTICKELNSSEVNFGIDNFIIISDIEGSKIEYEIKYGYQKIVIKETKAQDTVNYLLYLMNSAQFFKSKYSSEVLITASGSKIWNRLLAGFVPTESKKISFNNFIKEKYPELKKYIKQTTNIEYLSYITQNYATKTKYINNETFNFLDFYLIGKEFCFNEENVEMYFNKKQSKISQTEYLKENLFQKTAQFSLTDIMM